MRALVCGTVYGSNYLRAISQTNDVTLAGILSNGSQRSLRYAAQLSVPHINSVADIPENFADIACVAVSGDAGQQLVLSLLTAGMHVICEHPVGPEFVEKALAVGRTAEKHFFVNAHFPNLPAQQAFIKAYRNTREHTACLHHSIDVNLRTLYSGLDIIGQAIGNPQDIKVIAPSESLQEQAFASLRLKTTAGDVHLLCQNFASEQDDGSTTYINHRCSAVFVHGSLSLTETAGPVLWHPTFNSMPVESWQSVMPVEYQPINMEQLQYQRDLANILILQQLVSAILAGVLPSHQQPDYLTGLAQLWWDTLQVLQGTNRN